MSGMATVLAGLLLALIAGCGRPAPPPPPAPTPPAGPRVVVLSPAAAVIVRDLGYEKHVVGRHGADMVLAREVPVCGDQSAIDTEALRRVRPTHVLTQWGSRALPPDLLRLAASNGWHVREMELMTLADVRREIEVLDLLLRQPGARATELGRRFDEALAPRPAASAAGRVLMLGAVEPPGALGPGSCHHELLERLGVKPALDRGGPWQELATEDLRRIAPDVVVLVLPRDARTPPPPDGERARGGEEASKALGRLAAVDLAAIQSRRVVLIDHPLSLTPSTAMGEVARLLGDALERLGPP